MAMPPNVRLFSDAEFRKNFGDDVLGGALAADKPQCDIGALDVLGVEFGRKPFGNGAAGGTNGLVRLLYCAKVALFQKIHAVVLPAEACFIDALFELFDALARHGGDGDVGIALFAQIALGAHDNEGCPFGEGGFFVVLAHPDDDVGTLQGGAGAADALSFDFPLPLTKARRVGEKEEDAVELEGGFDDVARGARLGRDDGSVVAQEGVEELALAGIRLAAEDDIDPLADALAGAVLL